MYVRTIFPMEFLDLPRKFPLLDHVIVELIPVRECCEFGPRIGRQRAKIQSPHREEEGINDAAVDEHERQLEDHCIGGIKIQEII